jgi:GNAT superfamily N-acetyltransferase
MTSDSCTISPATDAELDDLLPLIAEYQRFYGAEPNDSRNRRFFARFIAPSEDGLLLGAWEGKQGIGFACLYWTFSSVAASDIALMNDLLVRPASRSRGVGRLLISSAIRHAAARGCDRLVWETAPANERAQRLYGQFPATTSHWLEYSLALPGSAA